MTRVAMLSTKIPFEEGQFDDPNHDYYKIIRIKTRTKLDSEMLNIKRFSSIPI